MRLCGNNLNEKARLYTGGGSNFKEHGAFGDGTPVIDISGILPTPVGTPIMHPGVHSLLALPIGFLLMAVEFGRVLAGRGSLYGGGNEGI